jgi:hypothetical protein
LEKLNTRKRAEIKNYYPPLLSGTVFAHQKTKTNLRFSAREKTRICAKENNLAGYLVAKIKKRKIFASFRGQIVFFLTSAISIPLSNDYPQFFFICLMNHF